MQDAPAADAIRPRRAATEAVRVGMAYGPGVPGLMQRNPGLVDYIELPFELLCHDPSTIEAARLAPLVLHCASMSIAGFVPPTATTLEAIAAQAERTGTPWIGEHLAFISADPLERGGALHDATTLTYTVCPQLSEEVLDLACDNIRRLRRRFAVPLIVENSPQYFEVPGSTMSIVDFVAQVHRRTGIGMLLDLTHLRISALNMGFEAEAALRRLPLEHLVEVHVSGLDLQCGTAWDDHAGSVDEETFDLLAVVLDRARPRAVTFEYNWAPDLSDRIVTGQIERVRALCRHA